MRKRTPQEKKELSYKRDRRNVYGEAPHAARKAIPLRKALRNRANRHMENQAVSYQGPSPDENLAEELESRIHHRAPQKWKKYPDAPLGQVIADKSGKRKVMREHGGRKALINLRRLISLKDFIRTGSFGPVEIGIPREELVRLLGQPDDYSTLSRSQRLPAILKYGDVEFHFDPLTDRLFLIFLEDFGVPAGGSQVILNPWIIKAGISREKYVDGLSTLRITWEEINSPEPGCTCLRSDSGVVALFVDTETYVKPQGLFALWKSIA